MPTEIRRYFAAASLIAAAMCLIVGLAWVPPATARGGSGGHGHARMGRGDLAPVYVVIAVTSITDADAFKVTMHDLIDAIVPFSGRLAADMDKPAAWDGPALEHVMMIHFDDPDQAAAWKNSDAFKRFDVQLQKSSVTNILLVQGLPMLAADGGRGGRGGSRFEPNVKEYDQLLNSKIQSICKDC